MGPGRTLQQPIGLAFVRQQRLDLKKEFGIVTGLGEKRRALVIRPFESGLI